MMAASVSSRPLQATSASRSPVAGFVSGNVLPVVIHLPWMKAPVLKNSLFLSLSCSALMASPRCQERFLTGTSIPQADGFDHDANEGQVSARAGMAQNGFGHGPKGLSRQGEALRETGRRVRSWRKCGGRGGGDRFSGAFAAGVPEKTVPVAAFPVV